MTKKDFKIIKLLIEREVDRRLKSMTESKKTPIKLAENTGLSVVEDEWPTMQTFNVNDAPATTHQEILSKMRKEFAELNSGIFENDNTPASSVVDLNNRPVNVEQLDPSLQKALTRDYSELVKRLG